MSANQSRWFAILSTGALLSYAVIVLLPGLNLGPLVLRTRHAAVILGLGWWGIIYVMRRLAARPGLGNGLTNIGAASLSILLSLLAADTVMAVRHSADAPEAFVADLEYQRHSDSTIWHGELLPRIYFPTKRGFPLHKPNVSIHGFTYGHFYEYRMLASPLLRDSVLQYRVVNFNINGHGLRENAALAKTRVYALGDSFVFGYATDEGMIWPDVLERRIGQPVYNMGMPGISPMKEVQLLQHMLSLHADSMHVEHLLWMIFEGNDLQSSYGELRSPPRSSRLDGTIVAALADLPTVLREQSIVHRLLVGDLSLRGRSSANTSVDGVVLRAQLHHSERFGYRFFAQHEITAAQRDSAYVHNHQNAPLVKETIRSMKELSRRYGFKVTVLLAPSVARLYGASFGLSIAARPYFLDYFGRLAKDAGFAVVDLAGLMAPYAERELIYYRDDGHWNARGHDIGAQLIAESVAF